MKILDFERAIIKKYSEQFIKLYKKGNQVEAGKVADTFPPIYKDRIIITIRKEIHGVRNK